MYCAVLPRLRLPTSMTASSFESNPASAEALLMSDHPDDPYHLERLASAKAHARGMGGPDKLARQHAAGRLSARERIAGLLDADSFQELGLLARSDREPDRDTTPTDGKITGFGEVDGRAVYIGADDATIKAGSYGRVGHKKSHEGMDYALKKGFPILILVTQAAGVSRT